MSSRQNTSQPFMESLISPANRFLAIGPSKIKTTEKVIDLIKRLHKKPDVLINGSAIGYYGVSKDLIFTEKTTKPGDDFLAKVTMEWENAAKQAEELDIRTVYTRFGVILGEK